MKEVKSCGVIPVLRRDGEEKFLLIHQTNDVWAFPKGHQEEGESDLDTALREMEEEVGITKADIIPEVMIQQKYTAKWKAFLYHKTVVYFIGRVESDAITMQVSEIQDYAWLSYEEALKRVTYESTKGTLEKAKAVLEKGPE